MSIQSTLNPTGKTTAERCIITATAALTSLLSWLAPVAGAGLAGWAIGHSQKSPVPVQRSVQDIQISPYICPNCLKEMEKVIVTTNPPPATIEYTSNR